MTSSRPAHLWLDLCAAATAVCLALAVCSTPANGEADDAPSESPPANVYEETDLRSVFDHPHEGHAATVAEPLTKPLTNPPPPPAEPLGPSTALDRSESKPIDGFDETVDTAQPISLYDLTAMPLTAYQSSDAGVTWMPGSGEQFGWLSFMGSAYAARDAKNGLNLLFNFHLLGGPESSPLPPRLFDFAAGYQKRGSLSERFSYDLAASIGVYSDFETSARDGVRYISHAVGIIHVDDATDVVFGVDYLDRDDIALLPVLGFSLRPVNMPNTRFDLIFPRPRIDYVLSDEWRAYLAGRLGGGTWDIEYPVEKSRVMTYRDLRLLLGFEHAEAGGPVSGWEFGYVFARELEFRARPTTTSFDDAFVLHWFTRR